MTILLVSVLVTALIVRVSYLIGYRRGVNDLRDKILDAHGGTNVYIRRTPRMENNT